MGIIRGPSHAEETPKTSWFPSDWSYAVSYTEGMLKTLGLKGKEFALWRGSVAKRWLDEILSKFSGQWRSMLREPMDYTVGVAMRGRQDHTQKI